MACWHITAQLDHETGEGAGAGGTFQVISVSRRVCGVLFSGGLQVAVDRAQPVLQECGLLFRPTACKQIFRQQWVQRS